MKKGVLLGVVLVCSLMFVLFGLGFVSAISNYCSPVQYNWTQAENSKVCDYGVSLEGFTNDFVPCNKPSGYTYVDGVLVTPTDCTDDYRKQQMTLNCLFALSNDSYEFNRWYITKDTSRKVSAGIKNFTINGQSCKVINAGYTYSSYYDCTTPRNTCHIPDSSGSPIIGNVSGKEYWSGWMVNITCGNTNTRYYWKTGYALFNSTTRAYQYPNTGGAAGAFFGYNRTKFFDGICPNSCGNSVNDQYNFGGIHSHAAVKGATSDACQFPNVISNNSLCDCPTDYSVFRSVTYASRMDYDGDTCLGNSSTTQPIAYFGGMYNSIYNNPITNAKNCPAGYLSTPGFNTNTFVTGVVYYCYTKNLTSGKKFDFGGTYTDNLNNPITNAKNCPAGFSTATVADTQNGPLVLCYKDISSCSVCYEDKDKDNYTSGNKINVPYAQSCPANYYLETYFVDLDAVDCNDNDPQIRVMFDDLGVDVDQDGFTSTGSCRARCVGNFNSNGQFWDNNTQIYSLVACSSLADCNDGNNLIDPNQTEVCNAIDDNCDGLVDIANNSGTLVDVCGSNANFNWLNLNGNSLTYADLNDSVLIYFGPSAIGKDISYEIRKYGFLGITSQITSGTTPLGYVVWKASEAGTYYFKMSSNNWITQNSSMDLLARATINNTKPSVSISSILPLNTLNLGGNVIHLFSRGQPIYLNKTVRDEDDLVSLKWYFGKDLFNSFSSYSYFLNSSQGNVVYSPNYPSDFYNIILSGLEISGDRNQIVNDSIRVYLLEDGINVIPIISSPNESTETSLNINFDASSSVVLNCSSFPCPSCQIINLAGKNCSYVHAPGTRTTASNYNLTASWKIVDGYGAVYANFTGDWNTNFSSVVKFKRYFNIKGNYLVQVNLEYNAGVIKENASSAFVPFSTTTGWSCFSNLTGAFWRKDSSSTDATSSCRLHSGDINNNACCPVNNNVCKDNGICSGNVNYCSDLSTKLSCENPTLAVVQNSFFGTYADICTKQIYIDEDCRGYNSCGCVWNNITGNCSVGYQAKKICGNSNFTIGTCSFETAVTGSCSTDNLVTVNSKAFLPAISPDLLDLYFSDCRDSTNSLPCPSTAKLPFASGWSIAIAVLVIVLVYFIIRKFHKKHL